MKLGGAGAWAATGSVLAGAMLLGFAPIGMRLSELGPQATAFWRFVFALPILALLYALERAPPSPRARGGLLWAGLGFGLDISLFHAAVGLTLVANATLLSNLTPLFAGLAGWLLFKERLGGPFVLGVAVALLGAALLALGKTGSGEALGPSAFLGDALAAASALGYAAYLLIVNRLRRTVRTGAVMFFTTLSALVFALAMTLLFQESFWPQTWRGWAVLVGLGLVVHIGGQGLIALGIGRLPIGAATVLLWVQPVTAALISWVLFGEAMGSLALIGAALLLAGIFIVQRGRVSREAASASALADR